MTIAYQTFRTHSDGTMVSFGRCTRSIKTACTRPGTEQIRLYGSLTVVWLHGVFVSRAPLKPAAAPQGVQLHPRVAAQSLAL